MRSQSAELIFTLLLVHNYFKQVLSNEFAYALCGLSTEQLIEFYGYEAEVHYITTEDGYILTVFRCNSKQTIENKKKPVIVQHGLLVSSDDFCVNVPDQALAYVLADAGFDVWLPNSRGNVYSRKHVFKDPNFPASGFFDFSWFEMGIYDQPAVIDYVLQQTNSSKLYYIGFSQGTTSIMVLLSEKPEYNDKIYAASLLAPVGYLSHVDSIYQLISPLAKILDPLRRLEFLPRNRLLNGIINVVCAIDLQFCNDFIDLICGQSENQRNNTILPAFLCHIPSGSSKKQVIHYGQEIKYEFFGRYRTGPRIPNDFDLAQITTPLSLHYSTADRLADASDVEILIPKLRSIVNIQRIDDKFNHIDFIWGMNSAKLVYSEILRIFLRYQ